MNERDMRNVDLCLFRLKWKKELIETLRRNWLNKIKLMISLLKKYLINYHQTELTIEYHDKYLKLKILISNENDFKDSSDWLFLKHLLKFPKSQLKIQNDTNFQNDYLMNWS